MFSLLIVLALFAASLFFAIVSDSLRNFHRSRLAAICRAHRREARFGQILRDDDKALQASKMIQSATFITALIISISRSRLSDLELTSFIVWLDIAGIVLLSWLMLIVFPWAVSHVVAERVLMTLWPMIHVVTFLATPFLSLSSSIDTLIHRVVGRRDPVPDNVENFTDEIQSVVDEGEREGLLESRAGRMIQRVMELQEQDVRAVMTTRTDIIAIQSSCSLAEARQQLLAAGHSRIPLIQNSLDDIIGILYARDLLESSASGQPLRSLQELARPPYYVPETTAVSDLLEQMQQQQLHLAIVLDEYGAVTGLVTLEDIIEVIVGDIADEFDEREEALYEIITPYELLVDARMHTTELNELFDLKLPKEEDFETIGGFVLFEMGRIPKVGEQLSWEQLLLTVVEATDRKIIRLELKSTIAWPGTASTDRAPIPGS